MDYLENERLRGSKMNINTMQKSALSSFMPWIIAAVILIILPYIFTGGGSITIMNQIGITIVLAMSYNMLLGQGGMLSFGHAVYMGIGGFVACLLYTSPSPRD